MDTNEIVIEKFHPHPLNFIMFYLSGIVLFVLGFFVLWPLYIIGILTFLLGEVSRRAETFYILDSGVRREYKLLATSTDFADINKQYMDLYNKTQNSK